MLAPQRAPDLSRGRVDLHVSERAHSQALVDRSRSRILDDEEHRTTHTVEELEQVARQTRTGRDVTPGVIENERALGDRGVLDELADLQDGGTLDGGSRGEIDRE